MNAIVTALVAGSAILIAKRLLFPPSSTCARCASESRQYQLVEIRMVVEPQFKSAKMYPKSMKSTKSNKSNLPRTRRDIEAVKSELARLASDLSSIESRLDT